MKMKDFVLKLFVEIVTKEPVDTGNEVSVTELKPVISVTEISKINLM